MNDVDRYFIYFSIAVLWSRVTNNDALSGAFLLLGLVCLVLWALAIRTEWRKR